ncbi:hypothetical protein [uncultured Paludibaculum sp.]|uniref:hypothetical protein n=1 Tax=uncultured Paludibaculum sp. TaxID=1765020 RepID=UPI002AAAFB69|nr:hypothetical protein [uncultured Paludibaculum sp.]
MVLRVLVFCAAAGLCAEDRDAALDLIERARSAPAEIHADVVFRLLQAQKVPASERLKVLEEVYRRAGEAREPHPWTLASPASPRGPQEYLAQAQTLRLDGLSIRCRAVQGLLLTNERKALELFDEIALPEYSRPKCEEGFVAGSGEYYSTLAQVVRRKVFTKDELARQRPMEIVTRALRNLRTPVDVEAAAAALRTLLDAGFDAAAMESAFASGLANARASDRVFSAALEQKHLVPAVIQTAALLAERGVPATGLMQVLRQLLVEQVSGPRCQDSFERLSGSGANEAWRNEFETVRMFNRFALSLGGGEVPVIAAKEAKPEKIEGRLMGRPYQDEAALMKLAVEVARLRTDGQSDRWLTAEEKQTTEWAFRAGPVFRRVEDWRAQEERDTVRQRITLWNALMDACPPGEWFRKAARGWAKGMSDTAARNAAPAEWLILLEFGMRLARGFDEEGRQELEQTREKLPNIRIPGLPHPSGAEILELMREPGDLVMTLYADLEKAAPRLRASWQSH